MQINIQKTKLKPVIWYVSQSNLHEIQKIKPCKCINFLSGFLTHLLSEFQIIWLRFDSKTTERHDHRHPVIAINNIATRAVIVISNNNPQGVCLIMTRPNKSLTNWKRNIKIIYIKQNVKLNSVLDMVWFVTGTKSKQLSTRKAQYYKKDKQ